MTCVMLIVFLASLVSTQYLTSDGDGIRHGKSRQHIIRHLKHNLFDYSPKEHFEFLANSSDLMTNDEPYEAVEYSTEGSTEQTENIEAERKQDDLEDREGGTEDESLFEKRPVEVDIVTRFLRIVESQQQLGENCSAGTDLSLGEGVVDRYAQERFRVEADVAVNRANLWTRLWKYAGPSVLNSEYLLHAGVVSMVEFDDDIFAAGNCYDQYQYKDYSLFCAYAFRLPDGPILAKNLAVEYKYMTNASEWFFIARKSAERIIRSHDQFRRGFNAYTYNDTAHAEWVPDEILSVKYEDGKWSKPYYDCGGGNIWMLTYTVPFFGYRNNTYHFKGTSGIDIDLRRVDIDQCPSPPDNKELNIFAGSDKCKKKTTMCVPIPGLGFRRGSYKCMCRRGFYYPNTKAEHRFYNGTIIEDEYEKLILGEESHYSRIGTFECLPCAEGCEFCIDNRPCIVSLNWVMRTIILIMSCVIILFLPAIVFFTWKYGNVKVVRAASPVLLRFITLGAFFIYCTPIVMYPTPNLGTCIIRVWLREIGFSLTYGALMLKTWRISVIFHVRSAKPVRITDMDLLKRLGMIVGVFCVFLIIRTLVAPPVVITGRTADDLKAYLCRTDWWDHSFTSMEVLFLIWGIRLCIVVRKAPSEFNEARFISMAIYNEFLLTVFLKVSMLFLQSPANPDLLYIIFFCHTQLTVTLLLCLIFGSKVYIVFRDQGKNDDHSGTVSKAQTTFLIKPKSVASQQNPSQSTIGRPDEIKDADKEMEEDFERLCMELESLKETNKKLGNHKLIAKIVAMQEASSKDLLISTVEKAQENCTSNSKLILANDQKPPGEKEADAHNKTDDTSTLKKKSLKSRTICRNCGGVAKKSNVDKDAHCCPQECLTCQKEKTCSQEFQTSPTLGSPNPFIGGTKGERSPPNETRLRYGHAKTHSIVINLDDNNRFTEEVTV